MYFKIFATEDIEQAPYLDKNKMPCLLLSCACAYTPEGVNEGWGEYASQSAALKALGLKPNPQYIG